MPDLHEHVEHPRDPDPSDWPKGPQLQHRELVNALKGIERALDVLADVIANK